jgi:hypothetical protein
MKTKADKKAKIKSGSLVQHKYRNMVDKLRLDITKGKHNVILRLTDLVDKKAHIKLGYETVKEFFIKEFSDVATLKALYTYDKIGKLMKFLKKHGIEISDSQPLGALKEIAYAFGDKDPKTRRKVQLKAFKKARKLADGEYPTTADAKQAIKMLSGNRSKQPHNDEFLDGVDDHRNIETKKEEESPETSEKPKTPRRKGQNLNKEMQDDDQSAESNPSVIDLDKARTAKQVVKNIAGYLENHGPSSYDDISCLRILIEAWSELAISGQNTRNVIEAFKFITTEIEVLSSSHWDNQGALDRAINKANEDLLSRWHDLYKTQSRRRIKRA